jgi:hypothetical protein
MKIIKPAICSLLMLIVSIPSFAAEDKACAELDKHGIVGKSIWDHAKKIRGVHYCESRRAVEADVDGDGVDDLVVSYSIEGPCYKEKKLRPGTCGNYHAEFLAVFLKKNGKYFKPATIKVGGRGERMLSDFTVQGKTIMLKTLEYHQDPMCCPSKDGTATLKFKNGKLIEEN